jgi:hypothetical protein
MVWSEVASKAIDFLQKPNALGFVILVLFLGFLAHVIPLAGVIWVSVDNTTRLQATSNENTSELKSAIKELGEKLERRSVARL